MMLDTFLMQKKLVSRPSLKEEKRLWKKNFQYVVGLDEVGRGAFAGPIVAGAVVFSKNIIKNKNLLSEINDSKLLTPLKREKNSKEIKKSAFICAISKINVRTINKLGIGKANQMVFRKVLKKIQKKIGEKKLFVIVDGFHVRYLKKIGLKNQKAIIHGDKKCVSIAAASIIAKVYRDKLMRKLHKFHPQYSFAKNKGYGTKEHQKALMEYGFCIIHRRSFRLEKFITR